ncbi:hypothetical protein ISS86_01685 [Candidatus Microgenomates bacterium]|nr:hypothetical protein [Candidatus Microgenomates bacterium]
MERKIELEKPIQEELANKRKELGLTVLKSGTLAGRHTNGARYRGFEDCLLERERKSFTCEYINPSVFYEPEYEEGVRKRKEITKKGSKNPNTYAEVNQPLVEEIKKSNKKILYEVGQYFGTSWKNLRNMLPPEGFSCVFSLYQPAWLEPEKPRGIGRFPLLSRLQGIEATNAYYGVGGDLLPYRSFLFMIGLEKYQKSMEILTKTRPRIVLFDACPYDNLNRMNPENFGVQKVADLPQTLNLILDSLAEAVDIDKMEKRRRTFNGMASLAGVGLDVISARDLITDESYRTTLRNLLERRGENMREWESLTPPRYRENIFSLLYPPMEVAEAMRLKDLCGIGVKIGDQKERGFDKLISEADREYIFGYTQRAKTKSGEKSPYRNQDDITFDSSLEEIKSFLERQPYHVSEQFQDILLELGYPGNDITEETIDVIEKVRGNLQ